ncbi:hypothetical protein [Clostridium saccharobutylicum]|nr:hypothetical protein [Clostridium saccharobutylicum]AQR91762.1 hypothetical protein CLOSC_34900 [Clostridium saccharobutylicum]AQS01664.1 hypothetical protein CSACC_34950 [Clostridium saccharobutylicum]AQS11274.1 hypothetical protein CLOBY_34300 [Clostridium saccharobutylicum]AQS15647.1 hypothetical protein CLOSACC_34950 [Clostridium saccharobutylicum]MBA2907808.1 hypothetical protein [Clostridium saccharobutylicum]
MKIKNKFLLGLCLIFLLSIMCGCGLSINQDKNENSNKNNMYNNNDKIVQEDNNNTYVNCKSNIKNNEIEMKYSGFSGIDTICFLEVKEDTEITFDYDSTVNNGKFKAVLINPKNEVETILEGTEQSSKTIKLIKGEYRFRNVGANADGKIRISGSSNSDVKITKDKKQ